jgi:hypothetical protein
MRTAQFDLDIARTNIAAEIEATKATLAKLEAGQALINSNGDQALVLIEVLTAFGKPAPTPKAETSLVSLDKDASDMDVIASIVVAAERPVRAKEIIAQAHTLGRTLHDKSVAPALGKLVQTKRIRRMSSGLYWRMTNGGAKHTPKALNMRETAKLLEDLVKKTLSKTPQTMRELKPKIEAANFPFTNDDHAGAIARALSRLGKLVKKGGSIGVSRTYALK